MGLGNFNVAPDNKGGRKKGSRNGASDASKDRDGFGTRPVNLEYETDAITQKKDTEDYWDTVFQKFCPLGDPTNEQIEKMAQYTQMRPDALRLKLAEWGVWEPDNLEELQFDPDPSVSSLLSGSSSSSSSETSTEESSSGLSSLIDNAK